MEPSKNLALPPQLIERFCRMLNIDSDAVTQLFSHQRVMSFRVNTLKAKNEEVLQNLINAGYATQSVPWSPIAHYLPDVSVQQIFHPDYVEGKLYVQGLSSMLPPLILDPQPGENILDLTAAPGSKTTQIAALMHNEGSILANDRSPIRLYKLQANLKQQGVTIARARKGPGELLWRANPEKFDRTLVDVPCSMEGRIALDDPESIEDWSLAKIEELAQRQKHLLRSAVSATKPGGVIVYSTCTLAPEENELVLQWLLEKEEGNVILEPIELPGLVGAPETQCMPGITSWNGVALSTELAKSLRIYPSPLMEGFFVARIRKLAPTITPESWSRPQRYIQKGKHRSRHGAPRRRR